jgi:galactose mutarotase-like enzyme
MSISVILIQDKKTNMFSIENDYLSVIILPAGAELKSLYNKNAGLEYMWDGDPAFWAKTSPVLFPIVGSLKNDLFYFADKSYQLSRHGFAREMDFAVTDQTSSSITFTLKSSEATLQKFPFPFRFHIIYSITKDQLQVTYRVVNTGDHPMYFSIGAHPAFKVPLIPGSDYTDHYLEFNKTETAGKWPISKDGLIETVPIPLLSNTQLLPLTKELFYTDAIVFKQLQSTSVNLLSNRSPHGLQFDFTGFPYLGIWAAKNADFVCIEPWCGIADPVTSNQQLTDKEGINSLSANDEFERSWRVKVF